jgi:phosphohistidine phosphatase
MELYLFRHGDAAAPQPGVPDEARELTERGRVETRAMAAALHAAGARPGAVVSSPLVRARQSAAIIAQAFGLSAEADDRLSPGCSMGDLQALLAQRQCQSILLVGHEPDLSRLIGQLTGGRVEMEKSAVARVDAERVEPEAGVLVWLVPPQFLASR